MLARAVTHPPSTQGIASRVVAPQRFAVVALAGAMVATSELLVESFGRPVPERLDPPFPDLRPPEVIQVDPPERERPKPSPDRSRPPRAVRRRTGSPPPGRPAAPRRRRVAPAWSWSWSAARPGGTGSSPSLVAAVAFGVGFGLLMAGWEEWGRRAERDQGCPVMPSCASPGAPGP